VWIPKEWPLFLGSLLIVAALYNHYLGQWAYFAELVLIAIGIVLALYSLIIIRKETKKPENGILVDLLSRIMTKEQSAVLVPLAGFLLIAIWSGWKLFVTGRTDLRMEDFIVTLFGASLVLHDVGPSKYAMEKDFVVLYLMFLTIVFAVIWKTYTTVSGDSYYRINAYSGYYFMTIPVVFLVRLFGVGVSYELDASSHGISNTIIYEYHGENLSLGIGEECSGLYSAGLFFTALLAFVLVRYRRVDRYILAALGLGFVLTWLSNILRMVLTILVGSIWGHPALVFVHDYIGILIFVAFVTVFWLLIVRWLDKVESRREPSAKIQAVSKPQEA
jgi:exosortase/archaeosortase family protein